MSEKCPGGCVAILPGDLVGELCETCRAGIVTDSEGHTLYGPPTKDDATERLARRYAEQLDRYEGREITGEL